jgi:hypothetical protein
VYWLIIRWEHPKSANLPKTAPSKKDFCYETTVAVGLLIVFNAILFLDCFHRYIKAKIGMEVNIAPGVVSKGTGVATVAVAYTQPAE